MFVWIKPIMPHLRPRAWLILLSCMLAIGAAALTIVPYGIAYRLITAALDADAARLMADLPWLALAAVLAILAKHLCFAASTLAAHDASFGVLHELRLSIARKCVRLPLDFFSRHATGRLKSVMRDDVDKLEDALAHAVPDIVSGVATPLLMLAYLVFVDWRLTLALFVLLPILVAIYSWTMRSKRALIGEYGRAIVAFNSLAIEFVRGMKTLKSFGGDRALSARLLAIIDEIAEINRQAELKSLKPWVLFLVGLRVVLLFVVPVGGLLFLAGGLDVERFALFVLIALVFTQPLLNLVYTAGSFFWKVSLAGRNIAWLMSADELTVAGSQVRPRDNRIVLQGVSLTYDNVDVLRDIDLCVAPGTMTALIGPSGAGKTSLARLIARYMDPVSGTVSIGGADIRAIGEADLMDRIGIVFQDTFLFDDTIYENILLGRSDASPDEVLAAAKRAQVLEFADKMPEGLQSRVGDNGSRLSGGQRQRVAIARLLLKNAPIVLLDEATASLDPDCETLVQQALSELSRGRTLVVIAHRLHTIRHADQIVFMQAGRITASGAHSDLLANADYARFWEAHEGTALMLPCLPAAEAVQAAVPAATTISSPDAPSENEMSNDSPATFAQGWRDWLKLSGETRDRIFKRAVPLLSLDVLFSSTPVAVSIGVLLATAHDRLTMSLLLFATVAMLACFVLSTLFAYMAQRTLFSVQRDAVRNLQRSIVEKLGALPIGFFQSRGAALLSTLFSTHLFQLDFITPPGQFVRAVLIPLLSGVILMVLDWRLGAALFACVPIFLFVLMLSSKIYGRAWHRLVASREEANTRSIEFLLGLPVIRAYRLLDSRLSRFSEALARERKASWTATRTLALSTVAAPALLELGFVMVMIVGAKLFLAGRTDLGLFVLFIVVGLVFYRPMFEALDLMSYGRTVARSAREIQNLLLIPPMAGGKADVAYGEDYSLCFDNVHFHYPSGAGLEAISFKVRPGTRTALVGGSGAGKSTVLALATRLWDSDGGSIRIGSAELRDLSLKQVRDTFSVVLQDTFLVADTIAANIRLGTPKADMDAVERAAHAAFVDEFIMSLPDGYETLVGDGGLSLSGGERQRIGIARAILKDAPILLLDEPTASIDPETEQKIRRELMAVSVGKSIIVATHNMDIAAEAEQILVLADGAIVARGTHSELIEKNGIYTSLVRQFQQSRCWTLRALNAAEPA